MFTDPERILLLALIIAAFLQVVKMLVPLVNGWGGVAGNMILAGIGLLIVFRFEATWTMLATYLLIALCAAGIHGTMTKISDHPSPHENPTPSGTPAQNYRVHVE